MRVVVPVMVVVVVVRQHVRIGRRRHGPVLAGAHLEKPAGTNPCSEVGGLLAQPATVLELDDRKELLAGVGDHVLAPAAHHDR